MNIYGNTLRLFGEFEGDRCRHWLGDVKYHLGFSSDVTSPGGLVHVVLAFNPSILKSSTPSSKVRRRQERRGDTNGAQVLPVLIHGDAAFAGQGRRKP